ncbi:lipoprotein-releasing system permease protein [Deferribacter desulfuricans SSM1]|uniref:Lipoprotein-releasing system permease protein n=1 Tax=Deferribacter desulfuricans (strain DSM 14783 / JCM 11476 / NBRC 101012 / SSM1) TaxID=639282 RepID=D3PBJ2_DEFDS|nr:lipoprotein-releasing ABC transporter permease subunit [Deferribacter desulfuricans]BAI79965.1 lipoprotein-releasing system permease protein [Deferribacter desulfuricans SSM1]
MAKIDGFIAFRYLKSKKSSKVLSFISFISIVGIVLGVATLIVVTSVLTGFSENLKEKIVGANSHIVINKLDGTPIENWKKISKKVEKVDGVVAVAPFIMSQVLVSTKDVVNGVAVKGIIPELEVKATNLGKFIKQGDLKSLSDNSTKPYIAIGKELANTLGVVVGDDVVLISPFGKKGPFGFTPIMKHFRVGAIFDTGMYEYNNSLIFVDLNVLKNFFKIKREGVSGLSVKTIDFNKSGEIAVNIQAKLGFPYWARDWLSMNRNLFSALKLEKAAMFVILTLIVVVASFNIISLITMTVKDKRKDIAILRSFGANQKLIRKIFVKQGLFIGIVGTIIGDILGYLICFILEKYKIISLPEDIYYMDRIPVKIMPEVFIIVSICAVIITYFSSIYPAKQAAKLDPVELLRNE